LHAVFPAVHDAMSSSCQPYCQNCDGRGKPVDGFATVRRRTEEPMTPANMCHIV